MIKAKYPRLGRRIQETADEYMRRLKVIESLEDKGTAFVFRPSSIKLGSRYDRDPGGALEAVYDEGYKDAMKQMDSMKAWIAGIEAIC